jgi:hypothetical protein
MSGLNSQGMNERTFARLEQAIAAKGFKPAGYTETEFGYVLMGEARQIVWEQDANKILRPMLKVFWVCGDFGRYLFCAPSSSRAQRMQACVDDAVLVCSGSPYQQPGAPAQ